VHTVVADPSEQPFAIKHRFGSGLLVLQDTRIQCNDVEHLRGTMPQRFEAVLRSLASALGCSFPVAVAQPDVQTACSATRWLRGWAADLIVSVGLTQFALQSMLAAQLLDLPRLLILETLPQNSPLMAFLPAYAHTATWIMVGDAASRDAMLAQLGEASADKLFVADPDKPLPDALLAAIDQRLRTPRMAQQPSLGSAAAFHTAAPMFEPDPALALPLLVLGAERTGSNLLVSMLATHPSLHFANELFNPRLIEADILPWSSANHVSQSLLALRHADPNGLFAHLLHEGHDAQATYAGFKLLYNHGLVDDRVVDMLVAQKQMPIVHLLRRQRLQRFASLERAIASDKWSAQGNEKLAPATPVVIPLRAMVTDFVQTTQFEQRFRATFQQHQILELDYQDFSEDLPAATQRLGAWLDIDLGTLQPQTKKTGTRLLSQSIANIDEVRAALAGTRWRDLTEEAS
jgi:LPS sulfotransferase NodH